MTTDTSVDIVGLDLHFDPTSTAPTESKAVAQPSTSAQSSLDLDPKALSLYNFNHQHGRRYHQFPENTYWLPNDAREISRLDLQHISWRLTFNGPLYLAPIILPIHSALDIGTGTGAWAIDLAREQPSCTIIGTDLSPIQPTKEVPPNVRFVIANAEDPWVNALLPDSTFDFIHSRQLLFGLHDWTRYFAQAWTHCAAGGWVQVTEPLFPMDFVSGHHSSTDGAAYRWSLLCQRAIGKAGIDTQVAHRLSDLMNAQGFANVEFRKIKWPIGPWAKGEREKELGRLVRENTRHFVGGSAKLLWTKFLGWTEEEVDEFLVGLESDLADDRNTYFWTFYVVWGQKPVERI